MVRLPIATALLVAVGFCSTVGGENATPELKAKPYWIGVTASHVAEPAGPLFAASRAPQAEDSTAATVAIRLRHCMCAPLPPGGSVRRVLRDACCYT